MTSNSESSRPSPTANDDAGRSKRRGAEQAIIHALLIACLGLGFGVLVSIYLPHALQESSLTTPLPTAPEARNMDDLLSLPTLFERPDMELPHADEVIARFSPEPLPKAADIAAVSPTPDPSTLDTSAPASRVLPPDEPTVEMIATRRLPVSSLAALRERGAASTVDHPAWVRVPEAIEDDVHFWKDIYAKYPSSHVVMHDHTHLHIVYSVLDLSTIAADTRASEAEKQKAREDAVAAERTRIAAVLQKLAESPRVDDLDDEAFRIRKLFQRIDEPRKFAAAIDRIRGQTGQQDKFIAGLVYSGRYLGEIESIFRDEGVPVELTRLVFVESMFLPLAHSSAGARGIWQIMPATARLHGMKVTAEHDERLDPLLSSLIAARILKQNYEMLGSWPLAVNAYNAGAGRLKEAKAQLGTSDIATIMKRFRHPAYGFASRNFYAEFLAALDVAERSREYFGDIAFDEPLHYDEIRLASATAAADIVRVANTELSTLKDLNPMIPSSALLGSSAIPGGWRIRLPAGSGQRVLAASAPQPTESSL